MHRPPNPVRHLLCHRFAWVLEILADCLDLAYSDTGSSARTAAVVFPPLLNGLRSITRIIWPALLSALRRISVANRVHCLPNIRLICSMRAEQAKKTRHKGREDEVFG